jgi:hypothetical protein
MDVDLLRTNPYLEALRVVSKQREEVCRLLAFHTFSKKEDLFNPTKIDTRAKLFKGLSGDDLATLYISVNMDMGVDDLITYFGIDKDKKKLKEIADVKKSDSNCVSFGARSIFGSLIVPACDKLNMTPEEVIWGISFNLLTILMADAETSVYLTDEEKKKAHVWSGNFISADDPDAMAKMDALGL